MELRPPTTYELYLWATFREAAKIGGRADPGPAPERWPADPEASEHVQKLLLYAAASEAWLTPAQVTKAFGALGEFTSGAVAPRGARAGVKLL
jgi:hypothetical protein